MTLRLDYSLTLPCGHTICHTYRDAEFAPEGWNDNTLRQASAAILYWLENRKKRHDCGLVSEDNPMGLRNYRGAKT